jgi:NitT/TauT family transport system ATP-binding protein
LLVAERQMHVLSLDDSKPVLPQVRSALDDIADGETLEVIASATGSLEDGEFRQFCTRAGLQVQPTPEPYRIRISKDVRPTDSATALAVANIAKTFQRGPRQVTYALENVSLDIREGEFVVFVGPSGCGKTTLMNILAGLEKPDQGTAFAHGEPIFGASPRRVVMFQDAALFPWLTVRKNVEFGLKMAGVPPKERKEKALQFLQMVHLTKFADSYVHELSGGMRQRTALARALAMEPEVLFMDEPFGALDAQTRDILHDELQKIWLRTKKTMGLVTHSVQEAVRLGDRVLVFGARPGRIKKEFRLTMLRPRDPQSEILHEMERQILDQLQDEVNKIAKEELDQGWQGREKRDPTPDEFMGSDI